MVVNFNKLWKKASTATNEADAVRTLAQILSSKEGRTFVLGLERLEAELCIEILDLVGLDSPPMTTPIADS